MPYVVRKQKGKKCVYKKKKNGKPGEKVGCTKKSIKKYLAALHINANESLEDKTMKISRQKLERIIKEEVAREMRMRKRKRLSEAMSDEDTDYDEYDFAADSSREEYEKDIAGMSAGTNLEEVAASMATPLSQALSITAPAAKRLSGLVRAADNFMKLGEKANIVTQYGEMEDSDFENLVTAVLQHESMRRAVGGVINGVLIEMQDYAPSDAFDK